MHHSCTHYVFAFARPVWAARGKRQLFGGKSAKKNRFTNLSHSLRRVAWTQTLQMWIIKTKDVRSSNTMRLTRNVFSLFLCVQETMRLHTFIRAHDTAASLAHHIAYAEVIDRGKSKNAVEKEHTHLDGKLRNGYIRSLLQGNFSFDEKLIAKGPTMMNNPTKKKIYNKWNRKRRNENVERFKRTLSSFRGKWEAFCIRNNRATATATTTSTSKFIFYSKSCNWIYQERKRRNIIFEMFALRQTR